MPHDIVQRPCRPQPPARRSPAQPHARRRTRRRSCRSWPRSSSTGSSRPPTRRATCGSPACRFERPGQGGRDGAEARRRGAEDRMAGRHRLALLRLARTELPALSRPDGQRTHQHVAGLRVDGREIGARHPRLSITQVLTALARRLCPPRDPAPDVAPARAQVAMRGQGVGALPMFVKNRFET